MIKFSTSSEDTDIQHAFVEINRKAVSVCRHKVFATHEDQTKKSFEELEDEGKNDSILCPYCSSILDKLESGETEVQRAYSGIITDIEDLKGQIKKAENFLSKARIDLIRLEQTKSRAMDKAKEYGIQDYM